MAKAIKLPKISAAAKPALPGTKLIAPKTKKGQRHLEKRAPKTIEECRKSLILAGNKVSQVLKDVMTDFHKLKGADSVKFSRKNEDIRPLETGGESHLEFYCNRSDCSLFALGTHTKKRPHNLTLGRMFDFRFYDAIELGIENFQAIKMFAKAATKAQVGSKPCIIFAGEKFESVGPLKQMKSLLLDFFRGPPISQINLAGLDRVMMATAVDDNKVLLRQYSIKMKKSGSRVPRLALEEMGPRLDFVVRRSREAPADMAKEAMRQPQLHGKKAFKEEGPGLHLGVRCIRCAPAEMVKEAMRQPQLHGKKVKNVNADMVAGKVGRIYMPPQKVDSMALTKMKGLKKEHKQATADAVAAGLPKPRTRKPGKRAAEALAEVAP
eukprot:gene7835-1035_t